MRKFKVFIFILGILITAAGAAILVYTIANHKIPKTNEVRNSYEIKEEFENFNINAETIDVEFKYSSDEKCVVDVVETDKMNHTVSVKDNALTIESKDDRKWEDILFFNFIKTKITISLPKEKKVYNELNAKITTGDVIIENSIEFNKIIINSTTGNIKLNNVNMNSFVARITTGNVTFTDVTIVNGLDIETTTGDAILKNVIAKSFNIITSTGDVKFDKCDANTIKVVTTTGDVSGSLLTNKTFVTKVTTGDVNVPNTTSSDICNIETTTGDITIKIANA